MSPTPAPVSSRITRRTPLQAAPGRAGLVGTASLLAFAALAGTGAVTQTAAAAPPALPAGCSGTSPVTCHYGVAPGTYDVTVSVGGAVAARTEVWAEARRLMLPVTSTAAGAVATYAFTVDVRRPEGQPTGQGGTGSPGLDLRFTGAAPPRPCR
ncbi:hypothetical protein [Streptomyces sp. NPDC029041]|uniref:hypothetical protein n=1 Tax=Streptomyces sp. NPDC029041 TaxID=3155727 RepID=UPI003408DA02